MSKKKPKKPKEKNMGVAEKAEEYEYIWYVYQIYTPRANLDPTYRQVLVSKHLLQLSVRRPDNSKIQQQQ